MCGLRFPSACEQEQTSPQVRLQQVQAPLLQLLEAQLRVRFRPKVLQLQVLNYHLLRLAV
jgi:hypothetical protein